MNKIYTPKDVIDKLKISRRMLDYYIETRGIKIDKSSSGTRMFTEENIEELLKVTPRAK